MNATACGLRRHLLILAALVAVAAPTVACTNARPTASSASPAAQRDDLQKFYAQKLAWKGCAEFSPDPETQAKFASPKLDCTYLEVPLDYAQPAGKTAQIAVLRQKATQQSQKIGSLVINPGGPGGSGIEAAVTTVSPGIVGSPLEQRFDLVGFDPRGVGASKPAIQCFTPAERDADRLDVDLDNSPVGVARQEGKIKDYVNKCEQRSGKDLLANAGTRDVAKDMDILRQALGDQKLTYLGYSYGTQIGYTYAEAFPQNVRALVLDGALDPSQSKIDEIVKQAEGFQKAFDAFAASCTKQPGCPLGQDPKNANAAFRKLVDPLETKAAPLAGGRKLSYNDAVIGVIQALYSEQLWSPLQRSLTELASGQGGRILMLLADIYQGRRDDGTYEFGLDAFAAIGCVDDKPITDPAVWLEADKRARVVAPFRDDGHGPSPVRDACAFWPVPNTSEPHLPNVTGLPQVMVISGTNDPATPYQAGVNLAKAINARLLTAEDNQHTVALQGNRCVDDYVTKYFLDPSVLPLDGARCKVAPA
ncbi:MAG: alpha/beta hydrolase [Pseudonocardia sp.]